MSEDRISNFLLGVIFTTGGIMSMIVSYIIISNGLKLENIMTLLIFIMMGLLFIGMGFIRFVIMIEGKNNFGGY